MSRRHLQANVLDLLRDDAHIYEGILRPHGVETKIEVWAGLPCANFAFLPTPGVPMNSILDMLNGF
ncbi:hypothetical protein F5884DRAFT_665198 [Xylogone sp. PMI_703]|nr:hypothetical protein F5884DRAFT_665198 [Xylogone sp. PMI_703]